MDFAFVKESLPTGGLLVSGVVPETSYELQKLVRLELNEVKYFEQLKNELRKAEWLFARYLLQQIQPDANIRYNEKRKPFLENGTGYISISHTDRLLAILLSDNENIGLDVQRLSPQLKRIQHKFISDEENVFLEQGNIRHLGLVWCAKEALYKLYGKGQLDFKINMRLSSSLLDNQEQFRLQLVKENNQREFQVWARQKNDTLIVWIEE